VHTKIKWGIIGLGKIANKFAADLLLSPNAVLQGVASRSREKAAEFGAKYHSVSYYGSYRELADSAEIDVVYIATPHVFHFDLTMMCLENGKSVLCEKPMGMNRDQVQTMVEMARSKNLFLMEGIWTRFIPATEKMLELIEADAIGNLHSVRADFGFKGDGNLESRVYKKALGGGSLLDIGIYPIYLSLLLLGTPTDTSSMARMTETGVDGYCSMQFGYGTGVKAILESSFEAHTPIEAHIEGSKGTIKMHKRFHHAEKLSVLRDGELEEEFNIPYTGNGYLHEIEEVNNCILERTSESQRLPHSLSLDLITIMDKVRKEIGLSY